MSQDSAVYTLFEDRADRGSPEVDLTTKEIKRHFEKSATWNELTDTL